MKLVSKRQELFQVNIKDNVVIIFKMKDDRAVSSLRKNEDESTQRELPIKNYYMLLRKIIHCIYNYGGPSSVYAMELHHNSDSTLKILSGHEFGIISGIPIKVLKKWVKDCLICIIVGQ